MRNRRKFLKDGVVVGAGIIVSASELLSGCHSDAQTELVELGDAFTYRMQRLLLPKMDLVRELPISAIARKFPAINTVKPEDEAYQRHFAEGFVNWKLRVDGLVARPQMLSMRQIRGLPSRTQVTQHNCEAGWSAIGQWTGVPLWRLLGFVGMLPQARFVRFTTIDEWDNSIDLNDALHPQTILAYELNGAPLPMRNGAPLRLRVERQLGYKSSKFVTAVTVTEKADQRSSSNAGFAWFAGI